MITLKKIEKKHLTDLYNVIYSSETPEWSKYNAPYFVNVNIKMYKSDKIKMYNYSKLTWSFSR